jgi:exodeoxyribonuclease VII large subunit
MSDRKSTPPRSGRTLEFDFEALPLPKAPEPPPKPKKPEPTVLTVAALARMVIRSLERAFPDNVWVEGEVSGARPAASGHLYFSLKDEEDEAVLDVVIYRSSVTQRMRSLLADGARVRVRGKPTFWAPRGKMQMIADRLEPTGKGALLEALERLKEKLAAEGLFSEERKRPVPKDPRAIGVVTSRTGAVIHDICQVAFRRGGARILLASAQVQGLGAAESVRRALRALQKIEAVDVVIVGRGGGSVDELMAFNDELLVRDVAACRVPVVSAVGHETDFTLVDFAADRRAATPSQAAELVVPDTAARRQYLEERTLRLKRAMHGRLAEERAGAAELARAFGDPRLLIASAQQRVDEHVARLGRVMNKRLAKDRDASSRLAGKRSAAHPRERLARDRAKVAELSARFAELMRARLAADRSLVARAAGRLDAMSPLKVLARGYAIATRSDDGRAVRSSSEVARGDRVDVRVADGSFSADVVSIKAKG